MGFGAGPRDINYIEMAEHVLHQQKTKLSYL